MFLLAFCFLGLLYCDVVMDEDFRVTGCAWDGQRLEAFRRYGFRLRYIIYTINVVCRGVFLYSAVFSRFCCFRSRALLRWPGLFIFAGSRQFTVLRVSYIFDTSFFNDGTFINAIIRSGTVLRCFCGENTFVINYYFRCLCKDNAVGNCAANGRAPAYSGAGLYEIREVFCYSMEE